MPADRAIMALHGSAMMFALAAALAWPRTGQAALLVPLSGSGVPAVLAWAETEQAALLQLDPARGRVIARIPSTQSLLSAIAQGIMPIATSARGCTAAPTERASPWTN